MTFFLLAPLVALQASAAPEPEFWPWDTVFEWEVNYWEWLGDEGGKTDQIPQNAQMIVGVKLYEKFGRQAYARADVGKEATLRVALVPTIWTGGWGSLQELAQEFSGRDRKMDPARDGSIQMDAKSPPRIANSVSRLWSVARPSAPAARNGRVTLSP